LALSPTVIAFSTGLIRDSLIGMFGFLMLLSLYHITKTKFFPIFLLLISALALLYLRPVSLLFFVVVAIFLVYSSSPLRSTFFSKRSKRILVGAIIVMGLLSAAYKQERIESVFDFAVATRSGEHWSDGAGNALHGLDVNTSGVTGQISAVSPFLLFGIAPFALIQPFPFYAWDSPDFIGGGPTLIDVMVGIGGLLNQLAMGFYVLAAFIWIQNKNIDSFGFRVGLIFTCIVSGLILLGLGQIRMTAMHVYPFFYLGTVLAILRLRSYGEKYFIKLILIWAIFLSSLYLTYLSLSILFLLIPLLGLSLCIFVFFIYQARLIY